MLSFIPLIPKAIKEEVKKIIYTWISKHQGSLLKMALYQDSPKKLFRSFLDCNPNH